MTNKLVFRWNDQYDSFVFALLNRAESKDRLYRALIDCKTWKELKTSVDSEDYDHLFEFYLDSGAIKEDDLPKLSDEIDWEWFSDLGQEIPYPFMLIEEMEEIIPLDILNQFSIKVDTGIDQDYYKINPENLVPMIKALTDNGFDVLPAGDLIFDTYA